VAGKIQWPAVYHYFFSKERGALAAGKYFALHHGHSVAVFLRCLTVNGPEFVPHDYLGTFYCDLIFKLTLGMFTRKYNCVPGMPHLSSLSASRKEEGDNGLRSQIQAPQTHTDIIVL
jgi:hypothetical protein